MTDAEREFDKLDGIRRRLEAEGYTVTSGSDAIQLPAFFEGYRPDAIASKSGSNIAIEVLERPSSVSGSSLQRLHDLFEGRDGWQFRVFFTGASSSIEDIPAASPRQIFARLEEIGLLAKEGHRREALVMGWSLLEASLQSLQPGPRPRTPGTVVDTLTMNGHVNYDTEQRLRPLITLRNRIVHGDLTAEPSEDDILVLVDAVTEALTPKAA